MKNFCTRIFFHPSVYTIYVPTYIQLHHRNHRNNKAVCCSGNLFRGSRSHGSHAINSTFLINPFVLNWPEILCTGFRIENVVPGSCASLKNIVRCGGSNKRGTKPPLSGKATHRPRRPTFIRHCAKNLYSL